MHKKSIKIVYEKIFLEMKPCNAKITVFVNTIVLSIHHLVSQSKTSLEDDRILLPAKSCKHY